MWDWLHSGVKSSAASRHHDSSQPWDTTRIVKRCGSSEWCTEPANSSCLRQWDSKGKDWSLAGHQAILQIDPATSSWWGWFRDFPSLSLLFVLYCSPPYLLSFGLVPPSLNLDWVPWLPSCLGPSELGAACGLSHGFWQSLSPQSSNAPHWLRVPCWVPFPGSWPNPCFSK